MSTQYVKIFYGPYNSFFTVSHKPQKLRGIRDHLQELGFRVSLVPVEFVNLCVIEMCGHEVFRCNIKNLSFNTASERDAVCRRAINAVVESRAKFQRTRDYLWLWALIDDHIFRSSEYAPRDYWPFDVNKDFDTSLQCTECCGFIKNNK